MLLVFKSLVNVCILLKCLYDKYEHKLWKNDLHPP